MRFAKLKKIESSSVQKPTEAQKGNFTCRCIWCDNTEHHTRNCTSYQEALDRTTLIALKIMIGTLIGLSVLKFR